MICVIPKMDLVLENGIYILWGTSSPPDKDSGERSWAYGPSCLAFVISLRPSSSSVNN